MKTLTLQGMDRPATDRLGGWLGETLAAGTVLLLEGDLGAGKTALVGAIARGLGIGEPVVSPTFVLLNEYPEGRLPLYHFDLYRLESSAAVASLHPELYWEGEEVPLGIVAIEWATRLLPGQLPAHFVRVVLQGSGDQPRQMSFSAEGQVPDWAERIGPGLARWH